ncbi:hypothetical protein XU18_0241 [Perkinsela sp. CCAP 1560/4]|nr:hypothetical protein XU18_0241 [Perkinsela sp. CCAP 1560/4]|eukprot:KNH09556.1 hypothetical protein XU18_0241 [Perkinsela sp. CCAP 1560/4]
MPWSGTAKLYACCFLTQQTTFFAYHTHSYVGQNPKSLKWDKPNTMRDVFLTTMPPPLRWKVTETYTSNVTIWDLKNIFPNPISFLYCSSVGDLALNCFVGIAVGVPWTHHFGLGRAMCVSLLGGMFAGGCFQFQSRVHPEKNLTSYDACSTSSGALSAMCSSFLLHRVSRKHLISRKAAVMYILYKLTEEYVLAPMHIRYCREFAKNESVVTTTMLEKFQFQLIEQFYGPINMASAVEPCVREWGSVGGVFLGMIWAALVFRTVQERAALRQFHHTLGKYRPSQAT